MNIARLILKLKMYWITNTYAESQINTQYLEFIKILNPNSFKKYSLTSMCMYKVHVLFPNIEKYIERLKYLNYLMETSRSVKNNWCPYVFSLPTLENFLIDKNGYRIDPVTSLEEFKTEYITYCNHILSIEKENTSYSKHTLRILTGFSSHLNALTLFFLNYTD